MQVFDDSKCDKIDTLLLPMWEATLASGDVTTASSLLCSERFPRLITNRHVIWLVVLIFKLVLRHEFINSWNFFALSSAKQLEDLFQRPKPCKLDRNHLRQMQKFVRARLLINHEQVSMNWSQAFLSLYAINESCGKNVNFCPLVLPSHLPEEIATLVNWREVTLF